MNIPLESLSSRGWSIRVYENQKPLLSAELYVRFPSIPKDIETFLSSIEYCISPNETCWFLGANDYSGEDEADFRWNELELMSLEGLKSNEVDYIRIRQFWDNHLPIMHALHSAYDYLAVCLDASKFGQIVHGYAPEFEETTIVAASWSEFSEKFDTAARANNPEWPFSVFLGNGT